MRFEKLALKNNVLKKKILTLSKELEDSMKKKEVMLTCNLCDTLKIENVSLKEKVLDLTKIDHNFTNRKKNFDLMLGQQKCVFDKGGIR